MAEAKTKPTDASVAKYIKAVPDARRRADAESIVALMRRATKQAPRMWGTAIVGFGAYHYTYESGREGDAPIGAFSVRKSEFTFYGLLGAKNHAQLLAKLGPHKTGKGCLYIKRLADVDLKVLEKLVTQAFGEKRKALSGKKD